MQTLSNYKMAKLSNWCIISQNVYDIRKKVFFLFVPGNQQESFPCKQLSIDLDAVATTLRSFDGDMIYPEGVWLPISNKQYIKFDILIMSLGHLARNLAW